MDIIGKGFHQSLLVPQPNDNLTDMRPHNQQVTVVTKEPSRSLEQQILAHADSNRLMQPKSQITPARQISSAGSGSGSNGTTRSASPATITASMTRNPSLPVRKLLSVDDWKTVGAHRRASHNVTHTQASYFTLSTDCNGLKPIDEDQRLASSTDSPIDIARTPVYEFFGGRNHGNRSLSFSMGQQIDDVLNVLPPPGFDSSQEPQLASKFGDLSIDHRPSVWSDKNLDKINWSNSSGIHMENAHRRTSTYANLPKPSWKQQRPSNLFLTETSNPTLSPNDVQYRRYSLAPPYDSQELASKYFSGDPDLLARRHSLAAAMALESPGAVNSPEQLLEFAQHYGNMIDVQPTDMSTASSISSKSMVSGQMGATHEQQLIREDEELRHRSWSEPSHALKTNNPVCSSNEICLVEFKNGRSDTFALSDEMTSTVRKGDLVIVEADRGKDLGKVIRMRVPEANLVDPKSGKQAEPKLIYRHAQPAEVNMLLDKARDEAKALNICRTKCKQKGLDMEVVDAEFQWDRKKLTFFFLAELRIDFRDLVKDLFKIYKTRIWMCAVERNRTNPHLRAYDDEDN